MKKTYESPQLTVHGGIEKITNAFGSASVNDTFFGPAGTPISVPGFDTGSIDACATRDDTQCIR